MANTGLGEAIGLQGKPDNYFFALGQLGQQEKARKAADEAAKKRKNQEDFEKTLGDFNIDLSKYHYKDRPKAYELLGVYDKAWEIYRNDPVNWRNKTTRLINDARFAEAQIQQDSQNKFNNEKLIADTETAKSEGVLEYGSWLHNREAGMAPPDIQLIPGGQIKEYNKDTGHIVWEPVKNVDLSKFAQESIFKPAETGKITTQASADKPLSLPTGEKVYQRQMGYDPAIIEANIAASVGGPAYKYWISQNERRLAKALEENPDAVPGELYYDMYSQDIKNMQPKQVEEYTEEVAKANVTNVYNYEDKADKATLFTDLSNNWNKSKGSGESYSQIASRTNGTLAYGEVRYNVPDEAVGQIQPVASRNALVQDPKTGIWKRTEVKGTLAGIPQYMAMQYGVVNTDGSVDSYTDVEYEKLSPKEKKTAKQLLFIDYKSVASKDAKKSEGDQLKGVADWTDSGVDEFRQVFLLEPGSADINVLNNRYKSAIGPYGKTMRATLKDPREDQTREKKTKPDESSGTNTNFKGVPKGGF